MKTELVKISGSDRKLALAFQFTLSKLVHSIDNFHEEDYEQLWYMCLHFFDTGGQKLPKKLKGQKLQLALLLRFLGINDHYTIRRKSQVHNVQFYCRNLFLDSHEFYGLKNGLFKTNLDIISFKILPKRTFKPLPYIGVGYKDKGSCSNPAINGVNVTDLIKAHFKSKVISFNEIDFNSSFDILEVCSNVDDDIEDHMMDY